MIFDCTKMEFQMFNPVLNIFLCENLGVYTSLFF